MAVLDRLFALQTIHLDGMCDKGTTSRQLFNLSTTPPRYPQPFHEQLNTTTAARALLVSERRTGR